MDVEWDSAKAASNFAKHGVRFRYAARVFLDPRRLEVVDDRRDYGEERRVTLGVIEDRVYAVVFTTRDGRIRLISARKANPREQARYATSSA
jgi:uncharacterized protein